MSAGASYPLAPLSWLGLLGGGQLGRMFAQAAQALGYRVCVLDPDPLSPAAAVADRHLCAAYSDRQALSQLAEQCPAVTTEFENVPADSLDFLAARGRVSPDGASVAIAQDRIAEKAFVRGCGIATAPYAEIRSAHDVAHADASLFPGILKAARLGYDGKGQVSVTDRSQALHAFEALGGVACVLEKRVDLLCEVSVLLARGFDQSTVVWPVALNVHREGILLTSTIPANIEPSVGARVMSQAKVIAESMGYVGVLCIEFFVLRDGSVCVNEMAPRPHNSGHWTLDASLTSQFEQQARVLAGLPLGNPRSLAPAVMLNLLGDLWFDTKSQTPGQMREPDWVSLLRELPEAKLHLYGKAQPRPGRKMGHLTLVCESVEMARAACDRAMARLGIRA